MPMTSLEYKQLLNRFGSDLKDIREELYDAVTEEVPEARRRAAMTAGRRKLEEYNSLLTQLDELKKDQVNARFGEEIAEIKESMIALGEK